MSFFDPQKINFLEIENIYQEIKSKNEDDKQYYESCVQDIINNPKRYWNSFIFIDDVVNIQLSNEDLERKQTIISMQQYYNNK